jgi:hypothetical protein
MLNSDSAGVCAKDLKFVVVQFVSHQSRSSFECGLFD